METKARVVLIWAWLRVLPPPPLSNSNNGRLRYQQRTEKVADSPVFHFLLPGIRNILRGSGKPSTHHPLPPSIPPCPALQHHCHTASSLFIYSFRTGAADPLRNNALGIFFFLTSPSSMEEKYTEVHLTNTTRKFCFIH